MCQLTRNTGTIFKVSFFFNLPPCASLKFSFGFGLFGSDLFFLLVTLPAWWHFIYCQDWNICSSIFEYILEYIFEAKVSRHYETESSYETPRYLVAVMCEGFQDAERLKLVVRILLYGYISRTRICTIYIYIYICLYIHCAYVQVQNSR